MTATARASRPTRRRCRNRKTANDMRNWERAHPNGVVVHMVPDFTCALPSRPRPRRFGVRQRSPEPL